MKSLYLLRHAKSSWENSEKSDFERPLNQRGIRNAGVMGGVLAERGYQPDAVFSSSAARTRETMDIIAPLVGYPLEKVGFEDILYLATEETLVNFIMHLDDGWDRVLLCGHNPGIEDTGRFFLGRKAESFPTCGFLEIRFAGDSWRRVGPDMVKKKNFLYPKMFDKEE